MDVLGRNSERHRLEMVKEGGVDLAMTAMRNHAKQAYVVEWSLKAICTLSADDDDARVCLKQSGRLRRESSSVTLAALIPCPFFAFYYPQQKLVAGTGLASVIAVLQRGSLWKNQVKWSP